MLESCIWSFLAVFILLGALAVLIRLTTVFFPGEEDEDDAPWIAAIHSTAAAAFPGARVTHIEEIKK